MRTKHIKFAGESHKASDAARREHGGGSKAYAAGGRVMYRHMSAGSMSGEGREQKTENAKKDRGGK